MKKILAALPLLASASIRLWADQLPGVQLTCPTVDFGDVQAGGLSINLQGTNNQGPDGGSLFNLRVSGSNGFLEYFDDPRNAVAFELAGSDANSTFFFGDRLSPSGALITRSWVRGSNGSLSHETYENFVSLSGPYAITAGGPLSLTQFHADAAIITSASNPPANNCLQAVPVDELWYGLNLDTASFIPINSTFIIGGGAAPALEIASGDEQIGIAGHSLPNPLAVRISGGEAEVSMAVSSSPTGAAGMSLDPAQGSTNQGAFSSVFTLGNVPADYRVTATCADCDPAKSSVTFTCCGKLATTDYKQSSAPWGTETYDSTDKTIGVVGCALTSLANLNNHYAQVDNRIKLQTPETLNSTMTALGVDGFRPVGRIVWGDSDDGVNLGIEQMTAGAITLTNFDMLNAPFSLENLISFVKTDVLQKKPVIIGISGDNFQSHYMVVGGLCGDKFIVYDPASIPSSRLLYDPRNVNELLVTVARFRHNL